MLGFFSAKRRQEEELPLEIYASLVDWLYANPFSMLSGAAGVSIAMLLTAWKTDFWMIWLCAAALALVSAARAVDMCELRRAPPLQRTREVVRSWEIRYAIGTAIAHALLGLWCFVSIRFTPDATAHLISATMTVAYAATGSGRNCGRPYIVNLQFMAAVGPLARGAAFGRRSLLRRARLDEPFLLRRAAAHHFHDVSDDSQVAEYDARHDFAGECASTPRSTTCRTACACSTRERPAGRRQQPAQRVARHRAGSRAKDMTVRELLYDCVRARADFRVHGRARRGAVRGAPVRPQDRQHHHRDAGRPHALAHLPADGERRLGRADRGHHRAQERRGQDQPPGALRCADRPAEPRLTSATRWTRRSGRRGVRASPAPSSSSTSTSSSRSTTRSAIPAATSCCARSPTGCASIVRDTDVVARFGGDEFVVLQIAGQAPEGSGRAGASASSSGSSEPYEIEGHQVVIGASIGIAIAPRDGDQRRPSAQERRHGALPRQVRRARHLALLRAGHGRAGAGAAQPRARPAHGADQQRLQDLLPAAVQPEDAAASRPARRCCAGRIPSAA